MKAIKNLLLVGLLALFTFTAANAQYWTKESRDRILADVPQFSFVVGDGLATDTTKLSTSAEYGLQMWDGPYTFEVSNLNVAIQSGIGDDTLGVQICWSDTIADATPYTLNTSALAVDSTNASIPGGLDDTSFDDATIPAGYYVWMKLSNITTSKKPIQVSATVTGHMQDKRGK